MSDYRQRLIDEKNELDKKLEALIKFKYTESFNNLWHGEKERLTTQCHLMCAYSAILGARIINATIE